MINRESVYFPDLKERVYFQKNGKILLKYKTVTDNNVSMEFDTVSSCVNYCRTKGLDPIIEDCYLLNIHENLKEKEVYDVFCK